MNPQKTNIPALILEGPPTKQKKQLSGADFQKQREVFVKLYNQLYVYIYSNVSSKWWISTIQCIVVTKWKKFSHCLKSPLEKEPRKIFVIVRHRFAKETPVYVCIVAEAYLQPRFTPGSLEVSRKARCIRNETLVKLGWNNLAFSSVACRGIR